MEDLQKKAEALAEEELKNKTLVADDGNLPEANPPIQELNDLEQLQREFLKNQVKQGKSLNEISTDYAKAKVTSSILNDETAEAEKYRKELAEEQKQTIKESFKQDKVKTQATTLDEKQKKAEAFYKGVRPILEFDFTHLIKKKENDSTEKLKDYKDRSYGIPLMVGMLLVLTVPYFVISIILALFNGINAVLESISTFGKVSRGIVLTIVIVVAAALLIYCGLRFVENLFGWQILPTN